jgi:hypothetical protein
VKRRLSQSEKDAMADAETLLDFLRTRRPCRAAAILRVYGVHRGSLWQETPEWAMRDAHAAFRAVPALREPEPRARPERPNYVADLIGEGLL